MSTTHDQMIVILGTIRPTYHQRHLVFSRNGGFDSQVSVQQAVILFHTIISFREEVLQSNNVTIDHPFGPDCQSLIAKMETGNRVIFFKCVTDLQALLEARLPRPRSLSPVTISSPTPINRKVMGLLEDQVDIVIDKRQDLAGSDAFNEAAFQEANQALIFSREVYIEQLRTSIADADNDDVFDCNEKNTDIKDAAGSNFVARVKAADTWIASKIGPQLA